MLLKFPDYATRGANAVVVNMASQLRKMRVVLLPLIKLWRKGAKIEIRHNETILVIE
jgi:hypothetical protein